MSNYFDPASIEYEVQWLADNPAFQERPATIREFLGEGYLEIESRIRPGILKALEDIFGDEVDGKTLARVQYAMVTGAIGIGKTTFASIAIPYMAHWVICLRDPQSFYNLLPGSRIAFMQMSTSETNAREVIFGDIFARIKNSPWFIANAKYDEKFTKQIRFPGKEIWILPGDSAETTFEGYNILGGIIDEMDSHKVTKDKDYADLGYQTIDNRITSRFQDQGLLICIGQMKKGNGFAAKKYKMFMGMENAHVTRMALWESHGWDWKDNKGRGYSHPDGTHDSFWYDPKRKQIVPESIVKMLSKDKQDQVIEIPNYYLQAFQNAPERALKDLVGIPPTVEDQFISLVDRIEECRDRWIDRYFHPSELEKETVRPALWSPVSENPTKPEFAEWFRAKDARKRVVHIDTAYSGSGDALGMAMGHIAELIEVGGELKPVIVIDMLLRIKATPGTVIFFSDVRQYLYTLRDDLGFKIKMVTMDGFNSQDTIQQLRKKRFVVDQLSVDKNTAPYEDTREAIYDRRLEFPPYITVKNKGDVDEFEVAVQEFMGLHDDGRKIDHPADGSKDVTDAVAGVVYTLMGNKTYRNGLVAASAGSLDGTPNPGGSLLQTASSGVPSFNEWLASRGQGGLRAPTAPSGSFGIEIPAHLRRH